MLRPVLLGGSGMETGLSKADPHCRGKKVATGFTPDDQEIIVDTKPKQRLHSPGNQASPRFSLTV